MSYQDFKRVFQGKDDEIESRAIIGEGQSNFESVPPEIIPELVDIQKVPIYRMNASFKL